MQEDTDLAESFEGEEGEAVAFPLSGAWWASIFNLFLAWETVLVSGQGKLGQFD
jgi:hypothetical protein